MRARHGAVRALRAPALPRMSGFGAEPRTAVGHVGGQRGLGAALREEMQFENGRIRNASFAEYRVPRFDDVPDLDIHLLNRQDLPSAGAGESGIMGVAPAVANAIFAATGTRLRNMPMAPPRAVPGEPSSIFRS